MECESPASDGTSRPSQGKHPHQNAAGNGKQHPYRRDSPLEPSTKCRIISCVGVVATFPGPWRGMDHQVIGIHEGGETGLPGKGFDPWSIGQD
jgi:hypothetical protein